MSGKLQRWTDSFTNWLTGSDKKIEDKFVYFWDDDDAIIEDSEFKSQKESKGIFEQVEFYLVMIFTSAIFSIISAKFTDNDFLLGFFVLSLFVSTYVFYSTFNEQYRNPTNVVGDYLDRLSQKDLREIASVFLTDTHDLIDKIEEVRLIFKDSTQTINDNILLSFDSILKLDRRLQTTKQLLNSINSKLEGGEDSTTNYQASRAYLSQISDGLDQFTAVFDEALLAIDTISASIKSIGKQTGMLALNAGIEAARAGELGIGFDVVANNLRRLAQHATTTTSEIKSLRSEINQKAKDDIEELTRAMESLSQTIDLSHRALNDIKSEIYSSQSMVDIMEVESEKLQSNLNTTGTIIAEYKFD